MKTKIALPLLVLLGCAPFGLTASAAAAAKPNFVFVLMDDMGAADGGCFGSQFYRTPNLDALAASGMRFTRAYAAGAVCSPTRAAIQTGKSPARLHLTDWIAGESAPKHSRFQPPDWTKQLPLEETTLAEALKQLGYKTAHIGKWHLGGSAFFPEHQGFDLNVGGGAIGHPASYFWPYGPAGNSHRVPGLAERGGHTNHYLTDQLTDEALQFIETNRDRPFYLDLCHYAVHSPLMGKSNLIAEAAERPGSLGQSNQVYAAMLTSVDESVGRILRKLDELKLTDRTVIVFTSDNGGAVHLGKPPATVNWPLRDGKGSAYEGGLRVPLIIRAPGRTRAGSRCEEPVISMDFFPTLLELAGADPAARAVPDGVSLSPLLKGGKTLSRDGLFWHYPHYWNGGKVSPYSVALVDDWKLIRFYETGRQELYHLNVDPSETHDLASAQPGKLRGLGRRLDDWLQRTGAQMPVPRKDN